MTELSPGCRVLCIDAADDTDFVGHCVKITPQLNSEYTVKARFFGAQVVAGELELCDCVVLHEIVNPDCGCLRFGLMPLGFFARRFALAESGTMRQLRRVIANVPKEEVTA